MNAQNQKQTVYTVVEVWRGMAAGAHVFRTRADADRCCERLSGEHDLQEDDVALFETSLE